MRIFAGESCRLADERISNKGATPRRALDTCAFALPVFPRGSPGSASPPWPGQCRVLSHPHSTGRNPGDSKEVVQLSIGRTVMICRDVSGEMAYNKAQTAIPGMVLQSLSVEAFE